MKRLTLRQQEVIEFIKDYKLSHGMPPTRLELSVEMGWSSANAAQEHLKALERKGALKLEPGASRGIILPEDSCKWVCVSEEYYETDCDNAQYFSEGGFKDNEYLYCPYCGRSIEDGGEVGDI